MGRPGCLRVLAWAGMLLTGCANIANPPPRAASMGPQLAVRTAMGATLPVRQLLAESPHCSGRNCRPRRAVGLGLLRATIGADGTRSIMERASSRPLASAVACLPSTGCFGLLTCAERKPDVAQMLHAVARYRRLAQGSTYSSAPKSPWRCSSLAAAIPFMRSLAALQRIEPGSKPPTF